MKLKIFPKGGPAVGLMNELDLPEKQIELKKGEKLFIYSDGITEATDENGDFFGEHRLMKVLENQKHRSADDLGQYVIKTVEDYRGNARINDDLSIVVLEKT
ncbi:MAG: PP2C family protein-serine/threonine phosphatase [Melioribacteraceae bacterium]|nr:PP2C family protein-serine/threonine phosphatase [Melioribacteraceae bacterium]